MAQLVLVPDVTVAVVQGVIFLADLVIVKKLMLDPYLKLVAAREGLTSGNEEAARSITSNAEHVANEISSRLKSAHEQARNAAETIRSRAAARRDELVGSAEHEAKSRVAAIETDIRQELERQKAQLPDVVARLTEEVYAKTVGR